MKIAITGASGFVGRAVLGELAGRGITSVVCATRRSGLLAGLDVKTVELDIRQFPDSAFERLGSPDMLIHLAWGGLPHYGSLHHYEQELPAQYRFLSGMVQSGLKSLVVSGTCFEYGMQAGELHENLPACPNNPYAYGKNALRQQLEFLKSKYPFALVWIRLFYLYGNGQAETSLLPQLRQAVTAGEKVFNMSGGEQLRDYLPVEDAANYLVSLALTQRDLGVVNVCSGRPISVRSLVEGWIRDNGWQISLNLGYYPYPEHEPMAFWGCSKKLLNVLALTHD